MQKRVLVAEDYDDTRELIKFILENDGHEVIEANDGMSAIERYFIEHPQASI